MVALCIKIEVRQGHIGFMMRMEYGMREEFVFARREESLGHGIIPAVPFPAHAPPHQLRRARILTAAMRVLNQSGGRLPTRDGVLQGTQRQRRRHRCARRTAYHHPGRAIDQYREIETVAARRDVGHIARPRTIRHGMIRHGKSPRQRIRSDRIGVPRVRRAHECLRYARPKAFGAHYTRDPMLPHLYVLRV